MISYLKRKDKTQIQSWWPIRDCTPTGDDITRHQNMNTQKEQHTWKTEHLTQQHGLTQSNKMNPKTNHDPTYPEGDKAISQTEHTYTWYTGQIPPYTSHCFIAIIYITDTNRRITRWTEVPTVRGWPVFHSENISEFFQLQPWTPSAFFRLQLPLSSRDASEYFLFQVPSSSPKHYCRLPPLQI